MNTHILKYSICSYFRILSLSLVILFCSRESVLGQENELKEIKSRVTWNIEHNLKEKLYVQTDKDFYLAGEIIWFKIYDINGLSNSPFDFSKVAYVELLDQNNTPVIQTKVSLGNSGNAGSILLPFTIHTGNYIFRAYTSWMRNFSPEYYFEKEITIVNTTKSNDLPPVHDSIHYLVKFFPEGGDLVNKLPSEVGFRVVNQFGEGTDFKGVIVSRQNDTVARFSPYKFGMGHFHFTPDINQHYKAIIRIHNGPVVSAVFPAVNENGYVMHVYRDADSQIRITLQTNIPGIHYCYLVIQSHDSVGNAEILFFNHGKTSFEINENKLRAGISTLTVFNNQQEPVCERLYFKRPEKELIIHAETSGQSYSTRSRINLSLKTTNSEDAPIKASVSVSVYKLDRLQTEGKSSILTYLWLTSELKGQIESPEYYLSNNSDSVDHALNNLMLIQGWRRFKKVSPASNNLFRFKYLPELSGQVISGRVINSQTGMPVPHVLTYFSVIGKASKVLGYLSDSNGWFHFNVRDLYGLNQVVVETNTQTIDSLVKFEIQDPFSTRYPQRLMSPFSISTSSERELSAHNLWTQIQHGYHPEIFDHFMTHKEDTSAFFGVPNKTYWLDNYTRYPTMDEVLKEYVQEVAVRRKGKSYRLMVVNNYDKSLHASLFPTDPLVLLDGVPVFDMDKLMSFDPLKIQKLDIVTARYFYGPIMADGILSFHTYKKDMSNFPLDPHAIVLNYKGLQSEREFYSPVYGNDSTKTSPVPDFRNVLYWSPDITTNESGLTQCSFYTSDLGGKYIIVINGIAADGEAGSTISHFSVTAK